MNTLDIMGLENNEKSQFKSPNTKKTDKMGAGEQTTGNLCGVE